MSAHPKNEWSKSPFEAFFMLLHHKALLIDLLPEEQAALVNKAAEVPHVALIARRFCSEGLLQEERELLSAATARIPEEIGWAYNLRASCEDLSPEECTMLTREIVKNDNAKLPLTRALRNHCPNLNDEEITILDAARNSHTQADSVVA